MIRGNKTKRMAQFLLLAFMAGEVSYAVADVLVLRSIGPSARRYPAGQRMPDSTSFVLRPGDSIAVLVKGGTRTFRGPGTFSATGPATARGTASAGSSRRSTGAVRGGPSGTVQAPADVWHLDVTKPGRACVATGQRPTLWRPAADAEVQLTITPAAGAPRTVKWAKGEKTLAWPAAVPVTDNATYVLSWTDAAAPTRLTTRTVAPLPAGDVDKLAMALLEQECRHQLDVLIAQKEVADRASAPAGGAGQ